MFDKKTILFLKMNFLINLAFCIVTYETKVYIPCLVEIAALNKYALDIFSII